LAIDTLVKTSTPHPKIGDAVFPVRVLVRTPIGGFGRLFDGINTWLEATIGRGCYAMHGAGSTQRDAAAWYSRNPEEGRAFAAAFPVS